MDIYTCFSAAATQFSREDAPKPNVILMMADDLGWGDVGYNGSKIIKNSASRQHRGWTHKGDSGLPTA